MSTLAIIEKIGTGKLLRDLEGEEYTLIQDSTELSELLDSVALPDDFKPDITGAIVKIGEGEYLEVYLTESARWYDLSARYYALPYYAIDDIDPRMPCYWQYSTYE